MLADVSKLKVLLVGDGIIDEYCYVTPLGKSIKDNMLSVQYHRKETFSGGVWAAAAHVRGFCNDVEVMTGPQITTNRRYVEEAYMRKLFVVHETKTTTLAPREKNFKDYDLVIVTDFGHGAVTSELIAELTVSAKFLAVNTQTNTSNFGFNMITKYPRADYVVLDELEARLATHDRTSKLEDIIPRLGFNKIIVTQGYLGATGFNGTFTHQKARADKVVDTMGAGDAFLSVSAPFACLGLPIEELVRIGNAAAAVKVSTVGHRQAVTPDLMKAYL
jgi:bifunctional ADP-heptose synthase (sugar kinase/adenylyltransferase)